MTIDYTKYPQTKRLRHHTTPNLYFPAKDLKILGDGYPPLIEKLEWNNVFLNGNCPVFLDIGCGKGYFLLETAQQYPDKNIMGIEIRSGAVDWIQTVIDGERLANCGVIWYSAANGLPFIESGSIEKIFYFFPDPWTKSKLKKRRLFDVEFLKEAARVLKDDGEILLQTDKEGVYIDQKFEIQRSLLFDYMDINDPEEWKYSLTNKEKFCVEKGIKYWRGKAVKKREV